METIKEAMGRLRLSWLPPYSPELNPDEWVWNQLKNHRLARVVFATLEELKSHVVSLMHPMQKLPHLIPSFFRHPKLSYITM